MKHLRQSIYFFFCNCDQKVGRDQLVVNFINILPAAFLYKIVLCSFSILTVCVSIFFQKKIGKKAAHKLLVKLTTEEKHFTMTLHKQWHLAISGQGIGDSETATLRVLYVYTKKLFFTSLSACLKMSQRSTISNNRRHVHSKIPP